MSLSAASVMTALEETRTVTGPPGERGGVEVGVGHGCAFEIGTVEAMVMKRSGRPFSTLRGIRRTIIEDFAMAIQEDIEMITKDKDEGTKLKYTSERRSSIDKQIPG